jgi:glycosyltransferase involved in cell wall biosynthesis
MKIMHVCNASSIHTQRWSNWFAENGHDIYLVSSLWSTNNYPSNIKKLPLMRFPLKQYPVSSLLSSFFWLLQLKEYIKKIKPDVVVCTYMIIYGYLGALSNFHPLIQYTSGSDVLIEPKKNIIFKILVKYSLSKADLILAPSYEMKNEILKMNITNPIKFAIKGVDTHLFSPNKTFNHKENISIPTDSFIIISTRHLNPLYDVETLINSMPSLLKNNKKIHLIVVGNGIQKDYLKKLVSRLDIESNVHFTGAIPHDELPYYLNLADVYVSTSLSDGTSNSLLEAMACGVPVVVTDIPSNRYWIKDGDNGYLFSPKNSKNLSELLLNLFNDPEKRQLMGRYSRNQIIEQGDYQNEMKKVESYILKVLQ